MAERGKSGRKSISEIERKERRKQLEQKRAQCRIHIGVAIFKWNLLKAALGPQTTHEEVALHLLQMYDHQFLGLDRLTVGSMCGNMGWEANGEAQQVEGLAGTTVGTDANVGESDTDSAPEAHQAALQVGAVVDDVDIIDSDDTDSSPDIHQVPVDITSLQLSGLPGQVSAATIISGPQDSGTLGLHLAPTVAAPRRAKAIAYSAAQPRASLHCHKSG